MSSGYGRLKAGEFCEGVGEAVVGIGDPPYRFVDERSGFYVPPI